MRVQAGSLYWFFVGANLLAAAGAGGAFSADLAIYDLTKGDVINVSSNRFREIVLDASPRRSTFLTLTRLGDPKLIMRERNANGVLLSEVQLPIFHSGYAWPEWINLSPDRKRAFFGSSSTKGLSLLSLESFREKELMRNVCQSDTFILLMGWVSDDTVLVVLRESRPREFGEGLRPKPGPTEGRVLKINVNSGKVETFVRPVGSACHDHALSESRELLAIAEDDRPNRVTLLDVQTMKPLKQLPPVATDQWVGSIHWCDQDRSLAFWNVGDAVYLYSMSTEEARRITRRKDTTMFLHGSVGRYVLLRQHPVQPRSRAKYFLHDVTTEKRSVLPAGINGRVFGIANNTRLVMEVGY